MPLKKLEKGNKIGEVIISGKKNINTVYDSMRESFGS